MIIDIDGVLYAILDTPQGVRYREFTPDDHFESLAVEGEVTEESVRAALLRGRTLEYRGESYRVQVTGQWVGLTDSNGDLFFETDWEGGISDEEIVELLEEEGL